SQHGDVLRHYPRLPEQSPEPHDQSAGGCRGDAAAGTAYGRAPLRDRKADQGYAQPDDSSDRTECLSAADLPAKSNRDAPEPTGPVRVGWHAEAAGRGRA